FNGSFAESRLREMMGDDFRLSLGRYLEPVAQQLGNPQVQHLPTAFKHVLISRLLYQRVLEAVDGFRWIAAAEHEFRLLELDARSFKPLLSAPARRAKKKKRHRAPGAGPVWGLPPPGRGGAEPRHQRVRERRGEGERGESPVEPIAFGVLDQDPRLQHRLGEF